MHKTIAVAMSGGVDSSAAALLLQEQGHKILGLTLEMFHRDVPSTDIADAKAVADQLGFPHYAFDFSPLKMAAAKKERHTGRSLQRICQYFKCLPIRLDRCRARAILAPSGIRYGTTHLAMAKGSAASAYSRNQNVPQA